MYKKTMDPMTTPIPIGIKTDKFTVAIAFKYVLYTPNTH